jgi:hypothetical protein
MTKVRRSDRLRPGKACTASRAEIPLGTARSRASRDNRPVRMRMAASPEPV